MRRICVRSAHGGAAVQVHKRAWLSCSLSLSLALSLSLYPSLSLSLSLSLADSTPLPLSPFPLDQMQSYLTLSFAKPHNLLYCTPVITLMLRP